MLRKDLKLDICGAGRKLTAWRTQHATLAGTACNDVAPGSAKFLLHPGPDAQRRPAGCWSS